MDYKRSLKESWDGLEQIDTYSDEETYSGKKQKILQQAEEQQEYQQIDSKQQEEAILNGKAQNLQQKILKITQQQIINETALAIGFYSDSIQEEEEQFVGPGVSQQAYIKVRNYIIALWRQDVSRFLSMEDVQQNLNARLQFLVRPAWMYLTKYGYINFGSVWLDTQNYLQELQNLEYEHQNQLNKDWSQNQNLDKQSLEQIQDKKIIIVGAGLAGLAAGQQLKTLGYNNVIILECNNRLGGRVYSKKLEGEGFDAVADLGGSIITGIDGNPLAVLAVQNDIPMQNIESKVPLYDYQGNLVDEETDLNVEKIYNQLLTKCSNYKDAFGSASHNISLGNCLEAMWMQQSDKQFKNDDLTRKLFDWHLANLEFANANLLEKLSLKYWDQDDPYEMQGAHVFLPGDIVLVTLPLGVLKTPNVQFEPKLPDRKQEAIDKLGFGTLNKIVMLFPFVFWDRSIDIFGRLSESSENRGLFFLFYTYSNLENGAILTALVAGKAALELEDYDTQKTLDSVLDALKGIYTPQGIEVPEPIQTVITQWGKEPFAYGSYSSVQVGSHGAEDYDILAEPINNKIFFAGEATNKKYPATMHGAFLSGQREAANIDNVLKQKGKIQDNALNIDNQNLQQQELEVQQVLQQQQKINNQQDQQQIIKNEEDIKVPDEIFNNIIPSLIRIFRSNSCRADLDLGCIQIIYGSEMFKSKALAMIDFKKLKGIWCRPLFVCTILTLEQVKILSDVKGGDVARISVLTNQLNISFIGRSMNANDVSALINDWEQQYNQKQQQQEQFQKLLANSQLFKQEQKAQLYKQDKNTSNQNGSYRLNLNQLSKGKSIGISKNQIQKTQKKNSDHNQNLQKPRYELTQL